MVTITHHHRDSSQLQQLTTEPQGRAERGRCHLLDTAVPNSQLGTHLINFACRPLGKAVLAKLSNQQKNLRKESTVHDYELVIKSFQVRSHCDYAAVQPTATQCLMLSD